MFEPSELDHSMVTCSPGSRRMRRVASSREKAGEFEQADWETLSWACVTKNAIPQVAAAIPKVARQAAEKAATEVHFFFPCTILKTSLLFQFSDDFNIFCNSYHYSIYNSDLIIIYKAFKSQAMIVVRMKGRLNMSASNQPPLKIKKRGEDGHRVITVRIRDELLEKLDKIAGEANYSRNELINIILEHGVDNIEIE